MMDGEGANDETEEDTFMYYSGDTFIYLRRCQTGRWKEKPGEITGQI